MNAPSSIGDRVARLRKLQGNNGFSGIPAAQPLSVRVRPGCQAYVASSAQARLWFLHQLTPGLVAYHMPALWRLRGELDVTALEEALASIAERHPVLRTSFEMSDGDLLQIIHPTWPITLRIEALADRGAASTIEAWANDEVAIPFDLTSGVLLRAGLLELGTDDHALLLVQHHLASDGWSRSVLNRDLVEFYNAFTDGRSPQLPPLAIRYQDYAFRQRERLSGDRLSALREYWASALSEVEPLELPTDYARPAISSHRGGSVPFRIDSALLEPFEALCQSAGATLQMGLLAVVSVLLQRYSRQDDIFVGVPVWGRNDPDLENVVGLFVNTVPIRTRFEGLQSFRQILTQVRDTSIAAYTHQELPFEQIVAALQVEHDTSRSPLVQVLFQLIEMPVSTLEGLSGLVAENVNDRAEGARFDLEVFVRRAEGGGLKGDILYSADLFRPDRIERMAIHLRTLLVSLLDEPDRDIDSLNVLPAQELSVIERWECGPESIVPGFGVHQLFEQQVRRTPGAAALFFEGRELSYAELNTRANRLAHQLIRLGVGGDDVVAVCMDRSFELIVAVLAVLKVGGAYLPLDPGWPQARRTDVCSDAGATIVIDQNLCRWAAVEESEPTDSPVVQCNPSSLAYVLYTSGSTGTPKGVAVPHRTLTNLIAWQAGDSRLGKPSRTLQFAAAVFDVSLQEVFTTLTAGGCLVLVDEETRRDPRLLWRIIVDQRVERVFLPYVALEQLALAANASGVLDTASLRDIVSAGENLSLTEPIREFVGALLGCRLHNHYGPTESHVVTSHTLDDVPRCWPVEASIGTPIMNTTVRILDPSGLRCPIGVPGELHIGGVGLARGYLKNPELTAQKFIAGSRAEARLYRSGDLASWNIDGTIKFHGRVDQQIKLRGFRIEPAEIEAALLEHPAVTQVAVVLHSDDPLNCRLVAYWVPGVPAGEDELRALLLDRLPDYMVPSAFVDLVTLPLNANGKLDRRALPAGLLVGNQRNHIDPGSGIEHRLHAIWTEVLGHGGFGTTDNFFLMGGHSLSAVRLCAALEREFDISAPVSMVFARPTIRDLSMWLQQWDRTGIALDNPPDNLVTLQPHGTLPPLYVVHGWGGTVACHVGLARELAPRRPVRGLQAGDHRGENVSVSVPQIAARYAEQILAQHPDDTMIHLVGHSAGGWYAHALAAALLERGAPIGMFAVLDSAPTARTHRRIGLILLAGRLLPRLRHHLHMLVRNPSGEPRIPFVLAGLRGLNNHLDTYLLHHRDIDRALRRAAFTEDEPDCAEKDFYVVLHRGYRPQRLGLVVDVFAPLGSIRARRRLWRFYARSGVRTHAIFDSHNEFICPESAPRLAQELESVLKAVESGQLKPAANIRP